MGAKKPPVTTRPIPSTLPQWQREVEGIIKFMSTHFEAKDGMTGNWVKKMRDHYATRLGDLYNHYPTGVKTRSQVKLTRERIQSCLQNYTTAAS